jgi:hypothetical protein
MTMLRTKGGFLLWPGWAVIVIIQATVAQDASESTGREMKIPSIGREPSFSLTIRAEGRTGTVIVRDEKGAELQNLICPLLPENPAPTESELAAVREQFVTQTAARDLDFDGHPDLAGIREFGAKWARYCVWLYSPKEHIFIKDFLAEQLELLTNLEPFMAGRISSSHPGPANPWVAVYRIAAADGGRPERQLVPVCSCLIESVPGGEKPAAVVITRYEGGAERVERQQASNMDIKAALHKCRFDVQLGAGR